MQFSESKNLEPQRYCSVCDASPSASALLFTARENTLQSLTCGLEPLRPWPCRSASSSCIDAEFALRICSASPNAVDPLNIATCLPEVSGLDSDCLQEVFFCATLVKRLLLTERMMQSKQYICSNILRDWPDSI